MPFEPQEYILEAGAVAVRVFNHGHGRKVNEFNPGFGSPTRFAFFGDPPVPVLYAAQSEEAAVCETILHEKLPGPGSIRYEDISHRVSGQITMSRDLRLASLMGDGLRVLGTEAKQVTATMASQYPRTVRWAEAAHTAGFDGVAWMSNRRNTDRAYMLFGDRVSSVDLQPVPLSGRIYAAGDGFNWISDYLGSVGIEIEIS